jgi:hypothetical protein
MKPVFRKLGYWDEKNKIPFEDKTVTFEQYLELVCGSVMNEGKMPVMGSLKFEGSILKRHGTFSGADMGPHRATEQPSEPGSPIRDTQNLKFRFPDNPTEEELEAEWQQFLENVNLKQEHHDHADEGAAFRQVKAAEKGTGGATCDDAHATTTDISEADVVEPDVKQEDVAAAEAQDDCEDLPAAPKPADATPSSEASNAPHGDSDEQSASATADAGGEREGAEGVREDICKSSEPNFVTWLEASTYRNSDTI